MRLVSSKALVVLVSCLSCLLCSSVEAKDFWKSVRKAAKQVAAPPVVHLHLNSPKVMKETGKAVKAIAKPAGKAVEKSVSAMAAQNVHLIKVIAGDEKLSDAGKSLIQGKGAQISAVAEAVSETYAQTTNVSVVAAESISGNVGKAVVTLATDVGRFQWEFATTTAIQAGNIVSGSESAEVLKALPVAAAIRSAEKQFLPQSKPIPDRIKARLLNKYPAEVLDKARWTIGALSISAPGAANSVTKLIGKGFAMTVGRVTVFNEDPKDDDRWWAHEIAHQIQYHEMGIDGFALSWMKNFHHIERDAENKAFAALSIPRWEAPLYFDVKAQSQPDPAAWQDTGVLLQPGDIAYIYPLGGAWTAASCEADAVVRSEGYKNTKFEKTWRDKQLVPVLRNAPFGVIIVKSGGRILAVGNQIAVGPFLKASKIELKMNDDLRCYTDNLGSMLVSIIKSKQE